MAETHIRHYIYGVLIFTLFIVGGVTMLGFMQEKDPTFATDSTYTRYNESFNKLAEVTQTVDNLEAGITDAQTDFGAFGVLNALISSSWQSLKLMFTSFSVMDSAYQGLTDIFGIPAWISLFLGAFVVVLIAFSIYSAVFQTEL